MMSKSFALALCVLTVDAAIPEHLVTKLPGYPGTLPTEHYSGFIDVPHPNTTATTVHVHYWLVMNTAGKKDAPTVIWHQGGPGGSSMIAFMTENGPLTVNDFSFLTDDFNKTGIPTVFDNPYSWVNAANMIYVEHPAPTGFSYCDGECVWDDWNQAQVNYAFLVSFFEKYPELADNEFFFTGESYAGVLVPTVSLQIAAHTTDANKGKAPWNLGGFMLGNDCPGNHIFTCTPYSGWIGTQVAVEFRFRHGMISEELYAKINTACEGQWGTFDSPKKECADLLEDPVRPCLKEAGDTYRMGGGYFLYDTCDPDLMALDPEGDGHPTTPSVVTALAKHGEEVRSRYLAKYTQQLLQFQLATGQTKQAAETKQQMQELEVESSGMALASTKTTNGPAGYYPNSGEYACGQEKGAQAWLNIEAVRSAIHVKTKAEDGRDFHFSTGLNYTKNAHSLLDFYKSTLIPKYRVMQFSGDADPCVPYIGTQRWVESLGYPEEEAWTKWEVNGQVAGYVTKYAANNFTFVTIRDAGHMAPRYKPQQALYMLQKFLKNEALDK